MLRIKKIANSVCLLLICFFVGCSNYIPKQEDFELSVNISKTKYSQSEEIEYTVKLTRKSGARFKFQNSSTLCYTCFEPVGVEPYFAHNDDVVTHTIDKNYVYEKTYVIQTKSYEPGLYLLSICFIMDTLEYSFNQEIIISEWVSQMKLWKKDLITQEGKQELIDVFAMQYNFTMIR